MNKTKLGVIFGGKSTENKVSVVYASYVLSNLNKDKYEIYPVFIDEDGNWKETEMPSGTITFGEEVVVKNSIDNVIKFLKDFTSP